MMRNSITVINTFKILTVSLLLPMAVFGATDYESLAVKAQRFYEQQEWASASAMYDLMLEQSPAEAEVYGKAIVSAAMRGDTIAEMDLMDRSIKYHVPFDSTFTAVECASFKLGKTHLYEDFLSRVEAAQPWLSRNINAYLLKYYTFRNDPDMMVKYSTVMLNGSPDNIEFLSSLARGYMLLGDYANSVNTYNKILSINPSDYDALLELGNYQYLQCLQESDNYESKSQAVEYLSRAYQLHPTPFVAATLKKLTLPQ